MSESVVDEGGRVCQRVWLTKEAVCVRECGTRKRPCVSESVVDEGGPVCQRAW